MATLANSRDERLIMENCLKELTKLKMALYHNFYNNDILINDLLKRLNLSFNLFSLNYENNIITMKIKKTDMKKSSFYECVPRYYYLILNNIFYQYFNDNMDIIKSILHTENGLDESYLKYFDAHSMSVFYDVSIILDNIIVIRI